MNLTAAIGRIVTAAKLDPTRVYRGDIRPGLALQVTEDKSFIYVRLISKAPVTDDEWNQVIAAWPYPLPAGQPVRHRDGGRYYLLRHWKKADLAKATTPTTTKMQMV